VPIQVDVSLPEYDTIDCANRVTALIIGVIKLQDCHVRSVQQSVNLLVPGDQRVDGNAGFYKATFQLAELGGDRLSKGDEGRIADALRSFFGEDWTITVL
jgi:hypothetical protein